MNHRIVVDRLFTLGDYKNMRISVDSAEIEESEWQDPQFMNRIREEMAAEVLATFARVQLETAAVSEDLKLGNWKAIYARESNIRHNTNSPDLDE